MKFIFIIAGVLGMSTVFQGGPVLAPKETKVYKYKTNNKDLKSFGYSIGEDGVPISVSDILLVDSVCYMLDPVHRNLKIVNLLSGQITVSQPATNGKDVFLTNLAEFNSFIYALSSGGTIYKYSKSGKLLKTIQVNDYFNEKYIYSADKTYLTFFQDADTEPSPEGKEWLKVKRLDSKDQIHSDKILMTYAEEFSELRLRVHGKKYSYGMLNGEPVLKTDIGSLKLKKHFKKSQYHPSINLDFTRDKVVYFDNDGKEVSLYCNYY